MSRVSNSTHSRVRPRRTAALVAGALAVTTAVAGGVWLAGALGDDACANQKRLDVTASPDIAPALREVAARLERGREGCVRVAVRAQSSLDVIDGLSHGNIRPPDVWVPDSSLWLTRADVDALASVKNAPSVAASPLVLAVTRRSAETLAPSGTPGVGDLLTAADAGHLAVTLSDQRLSPARVGAVLALSSATAELPDARAALASVLRSVEASPVESTPTALTSGTTSTTPLAMPLPEQSVWQANQDLTRAAGDELVAVYPGAVTYDYPYAVLTQDSTRAQVADEFFGLLRGGVAKHHLEAAGFRDADGAANDRLSGDGVDGDRVVRPEPVGAGSLALAERTLAGVSEDARLLVVMDVSGSMAWPVSGPAGVGPSRVRIAREAASEGLSLYPDTTQVGLWTFPGTKAAYDEVSPITDVGPVRSRLGAALGSIQAVPDGGTPLYAATLAAVRAEQRTWTAGKVNAVVVLSDGENTEGRVDLTTLLTQLRQVRDSDRPVPVITVAFGPQSDAWALAAISKASSGAAYHADSKADIRQIFLDALGQRGCRPDCATS